MVLDGSRGFVMVGAGGVVERGVGRGLAALAGVVERGVGRGLAALASARFTQPPPTSHLIPFHVSGWCLTVFMVFSAHTLRAAVAALPADDRVDVGGLGRADLLDLAARLAAVRRESDVLMALVAGEIDRRSQPEDGAAGLAAREGFRSARELIASTTGGSFAEAGRYVSTGHLLAADAGVGVPHGGGDGMQARDRLDDALCEHGGEPDAEHGGEAVDGALGGVGQGTPLGHLRRQLAERVRAGSVGVDVAALLTSAIDKVPDTERSAGLLAKALSKAPGLPLHRVRELVWRAQAHADPQAWANREERQKNERHVVFTDDADGMVTMTARLTPVDSASLRAVLDAGVRRAMQERRDNPDSDRRTPGQMRADLLVAAFRHMLDCEAPTSGVKTTVVVRISHEALAAGVGLGEIDGLPQPVSAQQIRALAADAELIPAVLSGESEVLDWGRAKRLFTPAQRLALVERDGGCAQCHAPPSWCEAHHIRWWERDAGPTDLRNGVLLCVRCHHRVHRDGWTIRVENGRDSFEPPPAVGGREKARLGGPEKARLGGREKARLGGRARFDVAA